MTSKASIGIGGQFRVIGLKAPYRNVCDAAVSLCDLPSAKPQFTEDSKLLLLCPSCNREITNTVTPSKDDKLSHLISIKCPECDERGVINLNNVESGVVISSY